ncbi:MAG: hypothetical protein QOH38_1704 [Thermoleophilaceae bacterium]|nr:hypothetical protein [Thermoleophilaceae bacterium]
MKQALLAAVIAVSVGLVSAATASADVGQPRTGTPDRYDRDASVVTDTTGVTYLYFARSQDPCNRLALPLPLNPVCPDQVAYDMYVKRSTDGGQDFGPAVKAAQNPVSVGPLFRGRTIAATATPAGVHVFWADGGNSTQLYHAFKPNGQDTFDAPPQPMGDIPADVFNVEAVSIGTEVFVYTQEAPNINARQYHDNGAGQLALAQGPVPVSTSGKAIPKAIVDVHGGCRMTYVDDSTYPDVRVFVNSSGDCLNYGGEVPVVTQPGSNWDPDLIQKPNGQYYLFFAPDHTAAGVQQQIAVTKSNDFVTWETPHDLTPGQQGGTQYWDYWPEGFVRNNQIVLFYTSERRINQDGASAPTGVGHIWTDPGFGGLDHQPPAGR